MIIIITTKNGRYIEMWTVKECLCWDEHISPFQTAPCMKYKWWQQQTANHLDLTLHGCQVEERAEGKKKAHGDAIISWRPWKIETLLSLLPPLHRIKRCNYDLRGIHIYLSPLSEANTPGQLESWLGGSTRCRAQKRTWPLYWIRFHWHGTSMAADTAAAAGIWLTHKGEYSGDICGFYYKVQFPLSGALHCS